MGEHCLWFCPYFSSSAQYVFFVLLRWFEWLVISGHTAAVLWDTALRIYSKHYIISLYCFHLAFSPSILLGSKWCHHTLVLTWKNPCIILSERLDFHTVDKLSVAVYTLLLCILMSFSVDEMFLPMCMNSFINFRDLLFNEDMANIDNSFLFVFFILDLQKCLKNISLKMILEI